MMANVTVANPMMQREPRAIQHPAEKVAAVAVNAEEMLRLIGGTAQQMDARRRVAFDVGQGLDRVIGGKHRRQEGNGQPSPSNTDSPTTAERFSNR